MNAVGKKCCWNGLVVRVTRGVVVNDICVVVVDAAVSKSNGFKLFDAKFVFVLTTKFGGNASESMVPSVRIA